MLTEMQSGGKRQVMMREYRILLLIVLSVCSSSASSELFEIQETVTVLCRGFPLVSSINDTSLQCARLRTDGSISTGDFNLNNPTSIVLFAIVNASWQNASVVNIAINFTQSSDSISPITDIRLALLVTNGQYTINNQSDIVYDSAAISILQWSQKDFNQYQTVDTIHLDKHQYTSDLSLCKWDAKIWNLIFRDEHFFHPPYGYFLKTNSIQLSFNVVDPTDPALPLLPPFYSVLYCIPFTMEPTEIALIIVFGLLVLIVLITISVWHYIRREYDNRPHKFGLSRSETSDPSGALGKSSVRHRSSASLSVSEQGDYPPT